MKKLLICSAACAALMATSAAATPPVIGPGVGNNTSANIIIDLTSGGPSVTDNGFGPYDGVEDTYLGVINHTGGTVAFLDLTGSDIFGLDGDGICTYTPSACALTDPNSLNGGYAGLGTFFSNITDSDHGRVNFVGGLANGATAYWTLEEPLSAVNFQITTVGSAPEPATWAMMLLGFFGVGGLARSRRRATAVA